MTHHINRDVIGEQKVRIGIIDSGINEQHPCIKGLIRSVALKKNEEGGMYWTTASGDVAGHGTACAGIICSYAHDAELYSVRILDEKISAPETYVIEALRWCIKNRMDVVNLSLGTTNRKMRKDLEEVCLRAYEAKMIIVAGQHGGGLESYPSVLPTVVGVGAADVVDSNVYFYYPDENIEFLARGNEQRLAWTNPPYVFKGGTSFAAPHITGRVAQIRREFPGASLEEIRDILVKKASPVTGKHASSARIRSDQYQKPKHLASHKWQNETHKGTLPLFRDLSWIKRAVVYPYSKEAHSLVLK